MGTMTIPAGVCVGPSEGSSIAGAYVVTNVDSAQ
jgi:hypothetical protein